MLNLLSKTLLSASRTVGFIGIVGAFVLAAEARPEAGLRSEPVPAEKVVEVVEAALPGCRADERRISRSSLPPLADLAPVLTIGHCFRFLQAHLPSRVILFRKLLI